MGGIHCVMFTEVGDSGRPYFLQVEIEDFSHCAHHAGFLFLHQFHPMKKILAAGCCVLAFQSFSQVSTNTAADNFNGRRVLIKAIAVIVNAENNRKSPPKRVYVPRVESPRY